MARKHPAAPTTAVPDDFVHLRYRGWAPTFLRLSPLQFRVLRSVQKGALLAKTYGQDRAALIRPRREDQPIHLSTFRSLQRRELVGPAKHPTLGLVYALTILGEAALTVYDL